MSKREFKICEFCKTKFHRDGERQNNWNAKRFCNRDCQHKDKLQERKLERALRHVPKKLGVIDYWLYQHKPVGG